MRVSVTAWITESNHILEYNWIGWYHPNMYKTYQPSYWIRHSHSYKLSWHITKNSIKCIPNNSTGNKRQGLTPSDNTASCSASPEHASGKSIQIKAQYRRTPAIVSTHITHLSKGSGSRESSILDWQNKMQQDPAQIDGQHLFKFQTLFPNLYKHPCGCLTRRNNKSYILDKLALAAVKSCIIHNA